MIYGMVKNVQKWLLIKLWMIGKNNGLYSQNLLCAASEMFYVLFRSIMMILAKIKKFKAKLKKGGKNKLVYRFLD